MCQSRERFSKNSRTQKTFSRMQNKVDQECITKEACKNFLKNIPNLKSLMLALSYFRNNFKSIKSVCKKYPTLFS